MPTAAVAPGLKDDGSTTAARAASTTTATSIADARYSFHPEELQKLRTEAPWTNDAKYFTKVAVSPSAIMKMMMHCHSGVEKGVSKGGNPIEVMGMLLGRPDPDTPHTLVVSDAFPLPIEGFETRVIADDESVVNHMIALGESLERTRKEKFMGWYHSHPFDLGDHSHCFLSQTDLSTELQVCLFWDGWMVLLLFLLLLLLFVPIFSWLIPVILLYICQPQYYTKVATRGRSPRKSLCGHGRGSASVVSYAKARDQSLSCLSSRVQFSRG